MLKKILVILLLFPLYLSAQTTIVKGVVKDAISGELLMDAKVQFLDSKIGTLTDSAGYYYLESYYATDSIRIYYSGYLPQIIAIKKDKEQVIDVELRVIESAIEDIIILPPDELPSVALHKKIVRNKPINDRAKLLAYEYELYNKIQFDLNNIGKNFPSGDL